MTNPAIRLKRDGALATVTLVNPDRLNAMTRSMWRDLRLVFIALAQDLDLRCIIVCGQGGAFCAGGDISEYPSFRFDRQKLRAFHEEEVWGALQSMLDCQIPLVAQIDGVCMGAGLEIASCCDIRLAGVFAKFGAPISRLGFPMAPREAALVMRAIGRTLAFDMLLSAGVHDAPRLLQAGFLLRVVADAELAEAAWNHAQRIADLAPQAARLNKRTFAILAALTSSALGEVPIDAADTDLQSLLTSAYDYADSAEHREGIAAFIGKRRPVF